jgi:hypothetical protein
MSMRGRSIRIAFGGNFVVRPESRMTLAGIHLLRTYMAGPQDLSQTDSANDVSRALLMRLGFKTILPLSIHWMRPLRPAQYAVYTVSRGMTPVISAGLNLAATPFCSAFDYISAKASSSPFRQAAPSLEAGELETETLLRCLSDFRDGYSLWPEYDSRSIEWLLRFMARMEAHGALRKLTLRNSSGKTVGWYVYYRKRGGVAEVVQIGGARPFIKDILDHLFHDAWNYGAIAIHGIVDTRLMAEFSDKNCIFTCRGGWTVAHSPNPELLDLLNSGDAFLSRLDGEWCLGFH